MFFKYTSRFLAFVAIAVGAGFCTFAIMMALAQAETLGTLSGPVERTESVLKAPDDADPWLGGDFQLGVVGGVATNIYRDDDGTDGFVLPYIAYDAARLHIGLDELRVTAWENDRFSVSAIGSVRFKPFDADDGPYLAGMKDRDTAFEAGLALAAQVGPGEIQLSSLFDVSGVHHGQQVDVSYHQTSAIRSVNLEWGGGVTWQSRDLADYMVGVRRNEVRANRAFYEPDDAFIPYLDLVASYPLSESVTLLGQTGVQYLPDAYTDSPIVDKDYVFSLGVGMIYAF